MAKTATSKSLKHYECGGFRFPSKANQDYYDRHVVFDHAVTLENASQRERFDAGGEFAACPCPVE